MKIMESYWLDTMYTLYEQAWFQYDGFAIDRDGSNHFELRINGVGSILPYIKYPFNSSNKGLLKCWTITRRV